MEQTLLPYSSIVQYDNQIPLLHFAIPLPEIRNLFMNEAELSLHVQKELLESVVCSPESFTTCKRRWLGSLTLAKPHPLLHMLTVRQDTQGWSRMVNFVSEFWCIAQAIFLPHPRKCDVVAHHLMAWKMVNVRYLKGPWYEHVSWVGILRCFPHLQNPPKALTVEVLIWSIWQGPRYHHQQYEHVLYGGHVLEHAQDEGISKLGLETCYMIGELIHHMVCWI